MGAQRAFSASFGVCERSRQLANFGIMIGHEFFSWACTRFTLWPEISAQVHKHAYIIFLTFEHRQPTLAYQYGPFHRLFLRSRHPPLYIYYHHIGLLFGLKSARLVFGSRMEIGRPWEAHFSRRDNFRFAALFLSVMKSIFIDSITRILFDLTKKKPSDKIK